MTWPNDRKFVDKDGKILDHWQRQLQRLSPLLEYSPAQFAALQDMISASLNPDDETDPGAAINLALPIDNEPLADEDWIVGQKNSASAGRRWLISSILALVPSSSRTLISTTTLSGASNNIVVPAGYTDIVLKIVNWSSTNNFFPSISYSEDGGSTFLTQSYNIIGTQGTLAGTLTGSRSMVGSLISNASFATARITVSDYASAANKVETDVGGVPNSSTWLGHSLIQSTAPINLIQLAPSPGTSDAGTVELWGIP